MGFPKGRIALDKIFNEWLDTERINPRILALEVADILRLTSKDDTSVPPNHIVVIGIVSSVNTISMQAIADYFESIGAGQNPTTVVSNSGAIQASTILITRTWIETLATEAAELAAIAVGFNQKIENLPPPTNGSTALAYIGPKPVSGTDSKCLAIRQEQHRKEGEQTAAEHLDAERVARQDAERAAIEKNAVIALKNTQLQAAIDEKEDWRRKANEEYRDRLLAEEALDEAREARAVAEEKLQDLADLKTSLDKVTAWAGRDKKLDHRERAALERLVYVLARQAGYKLKRLYSDEESLRLYAHTIGAKVPEGKGSIVKKLNAAIDRYTNDINEIES